ncbi:NirD/YgiW/YdeI family stress tolerance protein [Campylobacter concisus]|uniref:NirD/YgiW/YdeI family stress tolerance protein n=1 Tax=Campylobacter concisus TaxID=199 RepID=UPI0018831AEF|nr:NirD/YgiW/YdeI family stress tolerance protein [Campylobacter concisus]MBE9870234.1 NirD/YgiW/YdeI family stress tolerance protein [Campylobacter concisus]
MKKIIIASLAASIVMAGDFVSNHKSENVISVKEALKLNDDAKVMLEGKIKSHIKSDKYEFAYKNGDTIVVEIDNNKWGNVTANEDTLLKIRGEVDKELTKTKIDVDSVEVIK